MSKLSNNNLTLLSDLSIELVFKSAIWAILTAILIAPSQKNPMRNSEKKSQLYGPTKAIMMPALRIRK